MMTEYTTTLDEDQESYIRLKRKNTRVQRYAKDLAARKASAELALWERMEAERVKEHRMDGVGKVTRNDPKWYATMQDRRAFQAWASANRPALVKTVEEEALLNALVREYMRDKRPLPPGLGAYPRKNLSVYR